MFRRLFLPVVATLTAVTLVAGCGGDGTAPSTPETAPPAASDPMASGMANGAATPGTAPSTLAFTARTVDGAAFDGATLAGKPAVLWFWAPWCPTCAGQAAGVKATAEQLAGRVNVVGVAGLDNEAAMKRFIADWKLAGMPHLSDEAGIVWKRFAVTSQSTFVLLNSDGSVAYKGVLKGADLAGRATALT